MEKNNPKMPTYKGVKPDECEWLDEDTFVAYFDSRKCVEDDGTKTVRVLYAEVHLDEDNAVVIGENIYEQDEDGYADDYIDTDYYKETDEHGLLDMDVDTAEKIKAWVINQMENCVIKIW